MKPIDSDRKTGFYFLLFTIAVWAFAYFTGAQAFRFAAIGAGCVSCLWGLALAFDGVVKPIDQDRRNAPILIMITIASWTISANSVTEWYRVPCLLIGLVTFMWVMTLMGKAVDKHGWGDMPKDDDDKPPKS
jgi:hypothetical protein